jgi:hypothetical protein
LIIKTSCYGNCLLVTELFLLFFFCSSTLNMSVFPVNRVPDILKRMDLNSSQAEAMKTCFGILAIMSREDSNKILIAKDGMDIILNAMTTHVDRTDVQESGCDLLWSLAFNSSAVKDIIAKHGGATVLVRALKRHSRSADFLKSACGALSNMCQSKLNQEGVSSQGGLQPLVGSIHVHQTSSKLLPFIFDAIASIIVNNEENARTVSSLGIIPVVVASLSRHKPCMEVVKSGCHTLAILSDVKGQASKIAFAGGVPIILALLDAHPLYSDLHRVAAVVLLRMLQESAHVGREITCHEGVRILLNSLEKGGAQQDTVAAVTHILYTVTNPSSPASSAIESQLWIHSKNATALGDADDATVATSSTDMRSGVASKSSTALVALRDSPATIAANRRQSQVVVDSPHLTSGGASALGGIVLILGQYSARRDVVRAACRLVNNLSGYANVVQALDKLQILDRMLECVSVHRDTKDVLDSAFTLIKAVHRKTVPVVTAIAAPAMHGFLHLFRAKSFDEEFVIACTDICSRILEASSRMHNDRRREVDESRQLEGKAWESHALGICVSLLEGLIDADKDNDSGPMTTLAGGLNKTQSFSKAAWSKNSLRLIGSVLTFVESVYVNTRLGTESIMNKDMFDSLWGLVRVLPPKHVDLTKRLEKLLTLMDGKGCKRAGDKTFGGKLASSARSGSPVDGGFIPIGNTATVSRSRSSTVRQPFEDSASESIAGEIDLVPSPAVVRSSTSSSAPSTAAASGGVHRGSVGGGSLSQTSVASSWEAASGGETHSSDRTNHIEYYANSKLMIPQHPLKMLNSGDVKKSASDGKTSLLNCWPNHLERLSLSGNLSTGLSGRSTFFNQSDAELSSSSRMHICYESGSAAGKGLLSKCPTPVPYMVPPSGQGDPFQHSLTFDSEFESGNLLRAVQKGDATYDLFLRSDLHTQGHTQWFYFAVANTHPIDLVRLHEQGVQVPPVRVRFNIVNLTKPDSLFNLGMRPVVYSCQDATSKGAGWVRSGSDISYYSNSFMRNNTAGEGQSCYYTLSFTIEFGNPKDTVLIAYSYPFTMGDYRHHIRQILDRPKSADIIRQTRLCQTLGGDDCDLLVITNFRDKDRDRIGPVSVAMLESRFDIQTNGSSLSSSKSVGSSARESKSTFGPRQTLKPSLFVSARVHPGETPASWMMKGMLDFLTSDCSQAKLLRQVFVIFIVPMLNPDGVTYGNNRCSLAGMDLNRQWKLPLKAVQPTIFYLKSFMAAQRKIREVNMYIDLHGHSRKYNVFMYGCDDKKRPKPQVRAFPKFFSMHNIGRKYVCFADCSFHVKKGRESTARVVVAKDLNIPCSFTLEATFCGSNYGPLKHCHMNIGHMQEVGAALCDAILNFSISEGQVKDTLMVPANLRAVAQVERAMAAESGGHTDSSVLLDHSEPSSEFKDIGSYFKNSSKADLQDRGDEALKGDGAVQEEVGGDDAGPDRGDVSSGSDEGSVGDRGGLEEDAGSESEGSAKGGADDATLSSTWRASRSSSSATGGSSVFGKKSGGRDASPRVSSMSASGIAMTADRGTRTAMDSVSAKISALKFDDRDGGREVVAPLSDRVRSTRAEAGFPSTFVALESTSEPSMSKTDRL